MELTFKKRIPNCIVEFLKVFLHPPPPLERENFIRIVDTTVSKLVALSIPKIRM